MEHAAGALLMSATATVLRGHAETDCRTAQHEPPLQLWLPVYAITTQPLPDPAGPAAGAPPLKLLLLLLLANDVAWASAVGGGKAHRMSSVVSTILVVAILYRTAALCSSWLWRGFCGMSVGWAGGDARQGERGDDSDG